MSTIRKWGPVVGWMVLIFILSAQSQLPLPEQRWVDFVLEVAAHFVLYAVLAALLLRARVSAKAVGWRAFGLAVLICGAYAVSDEFHQSFVPGRTPDRLDVVVDLVGAAFGAGLWWYWWAVWRNRRSLEGL